MWLEDRIPTFIFVLPPAIQTVVAHDTEVCEDTRQTLENIIQITMNGMEGYRARLSKPLVTSDGIYDRLRNQDDEENVHVMYEK